MDNKQDISPEVYSLYERAQNQLVQNTVEQYLRRDITKADLPKIKVTPGVRGVVFCLLFNKIFLGYVKFSEDLSTMLFNSNPAAWKR